MREITNTDNSVLKEYSNQTILITGGRGYLGAALTQTLSSIDCHLILLDQSPLDAWMPYDSRATIDFCQTDISAPQAWTNHLNGVDVVFHLAAQEYYYGVDQNPLRDLQVNALPILALLEECKKKRLRPRIVFTSSANLFGMVDKLPVTEETPTRPLTHWAIHKYMAENYLRLYSQQLGLQSVVLRLANVYGPTPRETVMTRMVINKVLHMALTGRSLKTFRNRSCIRDYVYISDVVQALLLSGCPFQDLRGQMLLVGSGEGLSISKAWSIIAEKVTGHVGAIMDIQADDTVEIEDVEMRDFVADTSVLRQITGWEPRVDFSSGIDSTIAAFTRQFRSVESEQLRQLSTA